MQQTRNYVSVGWFILYFWSMYHFCKTDTITGYNEQTYTICMLMTEVESLIVFSV